MAVERIPPLLFRRRRLTPHNRFSTCRYYDGWRVLTETAVTDPGGGQDPCETKLREYVYGNYLDEVLIKSEAADDSRA